jgi:hypothetical protein
MQMGFAVGNSKLGRNIYTWSIPAGSTCPGKSEPCKECYAQDGFFRMTNVKTALEKNLELSKGKDFVDYAVKEITRLKAKVVRTHVAGDLYDKEYAVKWYKIISLLKDVRFFIYTRSWRISAIRPTITKMSKLPNLRMWWSVDYDTGKPINKPSRVRLAYMQVKETDIPKFDVDLIFRVDELRHIKIKRINKAIVCPVENGTNIDFTCTQCGICWRDKGEVIQLQKENKKTKSLPMVVI